MSNMPKKLNHTVEEIDRKLTLIDENTNLLEYPYETSHSTGFPDGLQDVGDGSILTTGKTTNIQVNEDGYRAFILNEVLLSAGKYPISLTITNILEESVDATGFELAIDVHNKGKFYTENGTLELEIAESDLAGALAIGVLVYLIVPDSFETDLLIKPQIGANMNVTGWRPYMGEISKYVDERFNSITAKFNKIFKSNSANTSIESIQIGSTTLSEADIKKILAFIENVEITETM
jgi:hypothetical protein